MRVQLPCLQGGRRGLLEHLASLYGGEPEAVRVGVVVAGPTAVALDERCASKLFQTGAGEARAWPEPSAPALVCITKE